MKPPPSEAILLTRALILSGCAILSDCALPKPHLPQSRSYEEFLEIASSPPQFQWAYCGSDSAHHYFAQWRYGAMLFHSGQSSYLKRHKVARSEMSVSSEFPATRDMNQWRTYSLAGGDPERRFAKDFLRKGDEVKPASIHTNRQNNDSDGTTH